MNARPVNVSLRSNLSGSISYVRSASRFELGNATANRTQGALRHLRNSRHTRASQNAPVNPLASALTDLRILKDLNPNRINTYAKTGGGSVILLTTSPKRNHAFLRREAAVWHPKDRSSFPVLSLRRYFIASLHQPLGIPFVETRTSHERSAGSRNTAAGKDGRHGRGKFDGAKRGEFVEAGGRAGG
jgi:hypothetical protein